MYPLAEGIHVQEDEIRFYGFRVQTRMAVVTLPGATPSLLLYSPVWPHDALRQELAALGRVAYLVAPNKIHNQTLAAWRAAEPAARLLAPPGLRERRPELRIAEELSGARAPDWGDQLEHVVTGGSCFFQEILLFHRPSGTLLVGDLVENFEPGTTSRLGRVAARLFGVASRPMASPEFRFYSDDADALARSLEPALGWPVERIFLCHGGLVTRDARRVFSDVCDELIATARRRGPLRRGALRRLAALQ